MKKDRTNPRRDSAAAMEAALKRGRVVFEVLEPRSLYSVAVAGDTNYDGKITTVDYSRIDNGYLSHLSGWQNGDFNNDGVVNGSDYTLIDNSFNQGGVPLVSQVWNGGKSANLASFNWDYVIPNASGINDSMPRWGTNQVQSLTTADGWTFAADAGDLVSANLSFTSLAGVDSTQPFAEIINPYGTGGISITPPNAEPDLVVSLRIIGLSHLTFTSTLTSGRMDTFQQTFDATLPGNIYEFSVAQPDGIASLHVAGNYSFFVAGVGTEFTLKVG